MTLVQVSTIVFFLAPMTAITVLYVLIGLAILRSSHLSRAGSDTSNQIAAPSSVTTGLATAAEGHSQAQSGQGQGQGQPWTPYHQQRRGGVLKMLG